MDRKQSPKSYLCRVCGYTNKEAASSIEENCAVCGIGLSEAAANTMLLMKRSFQLPRGNQQTEVLIILEVLSEPMLALLIVGFVVYFTLGDVKEAVILLCVVCLSVLIWGMAFGRQHDAAAKGQFAGRAS